MDFYFLIFSRIRLFDASGKNTSRRYEQFVGYKTTFRLLNSVEKQLASDANEAGVTTLRNSDMKVRGAPLDRSVPGSRNAVSLQAGCVFVPVCIACGNLKSPLFHSTQRLQIGSSKDSATHGARSRPLHSPRPLPCTGRSG